MWYVKRAVRHHLPQVPINGMPIGVPGHDRPAYILRRIKPDRSKVRAGGIRKRASTEDMIGCVAMEAQQDENVPTERV